MTGEVRHTGTCFLTYVALDKNGKPQQVPPLTIESDDEKRRSVDAEERRRVRLIELGKIPPQK